MQSGALLFSFKTLFIIWTTKSWKSEATHLHGHYFFFFFLTNHGQENEYNTSIA